MIPGTANERLADTTREQDLRPAHVCYTACFRINRQSREYGRDACGFLRFVPVMNRRRKANDTPIRKLPYLKSVTKKKMISIVQGTYYKTVSKTTSKKENEGFGPGAHRYTFDGNG